MRPLGLTPRRVYAISIAHIDLFLPNCVLFCAGQVVRFVPPLIVTADEVSTALSIIDQALATVTSAN